MSRDRVLEGYAGAAARLIRPYDDISPDALYRHVAAYLPIAGARVVDLWAGTGLGAIRKARPTGVGRASEGSDQGL